MKHLLYFLLLGSSMGLCGCFRESAAQAAPERTPEAVVLEDGLHFFVIGDWGRNGDHGQQEVADAMAKVSETLEPEFILSTGDNFYPKGIASVDDPYWISSYEQVYKGANLFCDWYVSLGNHDYMGNVQAEIDYTQKSRRWYMPSRYYFVDKALEDSGYVRIIVLDTSPLEDAYHAADSKYAKAVADQDTTAQLKWLDETLAASKARWNMVVGHHPLYTSGKRKDEPAYVRGHLEPILEKHQVDFYFAGHEHDLQYHTPAGKHTHHIVSGAGSELRPTGTLPFTQFAAAERGFVALSLTSSTAFMQMIGDQGQVLYQKSIKKGDE
jgi:hypothetical protein